MTPLIRPAELSDVPALVDLYNHYIATTAITFDVEPVTSPRAPSGSTTTPPPDATACSSPMTDDTLLGYASTSPFAVKAAYETSVEVSVYTAHDQMRRGVGTALYEALFAVRRRRGPAPRLRRYHPAQRRVDRAAPRFGFTDVGVYREVGRKFGRYHDVLRMQRDLPILDRP